jgi:hypothetical protein
MNAGTLPALNANLISPLAPALAPCVPNCPKKPELCGQRDGILIACVHGTQKTWWLTRNDAHAGQSFPTLFRGEATTLRGG